MFHEVVEIYSPITYYWTVPLILDHSYLVGNLTNSKIAETKALEPLKSWHFCSGPKLGALSNNRWSGGIHWLADLHLIQQNISYN